MRGFATALAGLVMACSSTHLSSGGSSPPPPVSPGTALPARQSSPLPTASPGPSSFPTTSQWPSPPPVARAPFPSCRLPYVKGSPDGSHFSGGFVAGSGGQWTADPQGGLTLSGDVLVTDAPPTLRGDEWPSAAPGSYDLALKRWLPVPRAQVRGDGLAYAYAVPYSTNPPGLNAARIHVVSLVDGSDRVIYAGPPRFVLAYETEGVYVADVTYQSDRPPSSLWRLDPASGAITAISNVAPFKTIDHGIAWTDGFNIGPMVLTRFDMATGSRQVWVDVTGQDSFIWFLGTNSVGHPLVDVVTGYSPRHDSLFVYTAPQVRTFIAGGVIFNQMGVTDGHGTWLGGSDGIYLLQAGAKLVKTSDVTGNSVAGGCN